MRPGPAIALLLLVAILAAPAPVVARPSRATVLLDAAVRIAKRTWPGACTPTPGPTPSDYHENGAGMDPSLYGMSWREVDAAGAVTRCEFWISPHWTEWPWWKVCAVVVHEYGHLAGQEHTLTDRRAIMYPQLHRLEACRR